MNILNKSPFVRKSFEDTTNVIKEVVIDKNAQNFILGKLDGIKEGIEK